MSTKIEWVDESWNPITGCTKISPGCTNCYAEKMAKRLAGRFGYPKDDPFKVTFHPDKLEQPLKWKKPRRIFVCSMSDFFGAKLEWMCDIFRVIRKCPQHTFMILTKRIKSLAMFNHVCGWQTDLENIWLGVSVENQKTADERIPILLQIPAAVRFVSVEPMLGLVDIRKYLISGADGLPSELNKYHDWLDWIICGCESGQHRRYTHISWIRNLRNQCIDASVPFFLKQMDVGCEVVKMPMLDGKVWGEYPRIKELKL